MITLREIGLAATQAMNEGRTDEAELLMEFVLAGRNKIDAASIERLRVKIKIERDKIFLRSVGNYR